jgi:hypothetical protein
MNASALAASSDAFGEARPTDGDYTLCVRCAELHVLALGRWRLLTDDELMAVPLDDKERISLVQVAIREYNGRR